jgi:biotin carboxyl carrier protein
LQDRRWQFIIPVPKYTNELFNQNNINSENIVSPMPGIIDRILVTKGTKVQIGDPLLIIVAMKMEVRLILLYTNVKKNDYF